MTRINLVPPAALHPRHLVAEYRELPRLFALIRADDARRAAGRKTPDPAPTYLLGPGHVRFFYNKAPWLLERQHALVAEMRARGMAPKFLPSPALLEGIDMARQLPHWAPSAAEIATNTARLHERLAAMRALDWTRHVPHPP